MKNNLQHKANSIAMSQLYVLFFLAIFFSPQVAISQSSRNVLTGKVIDASGLPLQYVTIALRKDTTLIDYAVSDGAGSYIFKNLTNNGRYLLSFSLLGYKRADTSIVLADFRLLTTMQRETIQLTQVNVTGKKRLIERKVDRLVFNVENNINTVGADALVVLGKAPMVRIVDDKIKMVGKNGSVAVMVDGRLLKLDGDGIAAYLKTLDAANISSIEVITNPPAQYEAQGDNGMLNIVTKKVRTPGYFATLNSNISVTRYVSLSQGLSLNYNTKKVLFYGNLMAGKGNTGPRTGQLREYPLQLWSMSERRKEESRFLRGTIAMEYQLSASTTLGTSVTITRSAPDVGGIRRTVVGGNLGQIDSVITASFNNELAISNAMINLHLGSNLGKSGAKLAIDADYFNNASDRSNTSDNSNVLSDGSPAFSPIERLNSANDVYTRGYSLNSEINMQRKKYSFVFGAKWSFVYYGSEVSLLSSLSGSSPALENLFRFHENTQAVFASASSTFGKLGAKAGLRGEATQGRALSPQNGQTSNNNYISLFPTVYLSYKLGKKNTLSLSYGRRISRPGFSSYNPYSIYADRYSFSVGNPRLQPTFTHNIEASNTFNGVLFTSLSYSISNHQNSGVQIIKAGSASQESIIGNFFSSRNVVLTNSLSLNPFPWFEHSSEVSVYHSRTTSELSVTPSVVAGFGGDLRTMNTFYLNKSKTLTGGTTFYYQFPNVSILYRMGEVYYLDLTAGYLLAGKKLQLSIGVRDLFKSNTVSFDTEINGINVHTTANNDSRRVLFGLKYSFGNTKIKKGKSYNGIGNEQSRANN